MPFTPNQRRFVAYPSAAVVAAGLVWAGLHQAEADFLTLVSSASIHAQLAAQIPADTENVEGRELRASLLRDARAFLERAERVEPHSCAVQQAHAYLAMADGEHVRAAEIYRRCRSMPDCTPDQLGPLVINEAKALSNAGREREALQLMDEEIGARRDEDVVAWSSLRSRLLFRAGDVTAAMAEARALADVPSEDGRASQIAAGLLEDMGDFQAAEAAWRRSGLDGAMEEYVVARLKLRAGDTDTASSLLGRSVAAGDPGVLRQIGRDRDLWVDSIGSERFSRVTAPSGELAAPPAGR